MAGKSPYFKTKFANHEVRWEEKNGISFNGVKRVLARKTSQAEFPKEKEVAPPLPMSSAGIPQTTSHIKQQSMCNLLYMGHSTMQSNKPGVGGFGVQDPVRIPLHQ